jgi:hypothetical protein
MTPRRRYFFSAISLIRAIQKLLRPALVLELRAVGGVYCFLERTIVIWLVW